MRLAFNVVVPVFPPVARRSEVKTRLTPVKPELRSLSDRESADLLRLKFEVEGQFWSPSRGRTSVAVESTAVG